MTLHPDASVQEPTIPDPPGSLGLRPRVLSMPEVLAQSMSVIAPSAAVALTVGLVFASAGNGTWLSFVAAAIVMLLVGYCVSMFARRMASAGSFYVYATQGLGATGGFLAGWSLILGYLATAMATTLGFDIYLLPLLGQFGIPTNGLTQVIAFVACLGGAAYVSFRDIRLSAKLTLTLEAISVTIILILTVAILVRHGFTISTAQLTLRGASAHGIALGMVLAIFTFVGFESSASMGVEAGDPFRSIPRAVLGSVAIVGVFFVVSSYAQPLGFTGSSQSLATSQAPLAALTGIVGMGFLKPFIDIGISISMFSCTLGSFNAATRTLATMADDGIFARSLARTHPHHRTPHVAIAMLIPPVMLIPGILVVLGNSVLVVVGWTGTIATFGFMGAYVLVAVGLPVYLRREIGATQLVPTVVGAVTTLALAYIFYNSVIPVPAFPSNLVPYAFVVWLAGGLAWISLTTRRSSVGAATIGQCFDIPPALALDSRAGLEPLEPSA